MGCSGPAPSEGLRRLASMIRATVGHGGATGYGAKGVDSGADAGGLQKAGITSQKGDGWPGQMPSLFTRIGATSGATFR